ncbi:MAG: RNA polymerase sigma factor [Planctomycetes bacterium]|nr:RNA polymerase sigma factor [Planctomycetota bacterium]
MRGHDTARIETERALIQRCVKGDIEGWEEMIHQYGALVVHAARTTLLRVLKNVDPNQVDEAAQAVWTALCEDGCRRLKSFAGQSALSTWLTVLSTRRTLDFIRTELRKGAMRHVQLETEGFNLLNDLKDTHEADPQASEDELQLLHEAMERLPSEDRLILKMYYLDGLSYRTIAQTLRVAPNTVSSYIFRAREKLKQILNKSP